MNPQGGTSATRLAERAIGNGDAGLYADSQLHDQCGWVALLRALFHQEAVRKAWVGDLSWLKYDGKQLTKLFQTKRQLKMLVIALKNQLGIQDSVWDLDPMDGLSTQDKIIQVQPKLLIVIMNSAMKRRQYIHRGEEWEWKPYNESATVNIAFTPDFTKKRQVGHLRGIKSMKEFLSCSHTQHDGSVWCDFCIGYRSITHECNGRQFVCDSCGEQFSDLFGWDNHMITEKKDKKIQCTHCDKELYNEDCLTFHLKHCQRRNVNHCPRCRKSMDGRPVEDHKCCEYKCACCEEWVDPTHVCFIGKPKKYVRVTGDA